METVGNQSRINKALAAAVGDPGTVTAAATPASTDIPAGLSYVEVTSAAATDGVRLADLPVGARVAGYNPSGFAFKLRATGTATTGKINNVDCSGAAAGASIPTLHYFSCQKTSSGWFCTALTAAGAALALVPA